MLEHRWSQTAPPDFVAGQDEGEVSKEYEASKASAALALGSVGVQFLDLAKVQPASLICVGARKGYEALPFINRWSELDVTCVDVNPAFEADAEKYGFSFVCADANNLEFEDQAFDVLLSLCTVEHFWNPRSAIAEILRVTKKAAIISFPMESPEEFHKDPHHYTRIDTFSEWIAMMEEYQDWMLRYLLTTGFKGDRPVHFIAGFTRKGAV